MVDAKLALIISGAGFGITILVLIIISVIVRAISLAVQRLSAERS